MKEISTWHIHIKGQVQGVGFRPFVYQLAQKFGLKGWVNNSSDGVHIEFNADDVTAQMLYDESVINAPQLAHITSYSLEKIASVAYEVFQIISSSNQDNPVLLISPDFAMCEECRKEISDKNNRRYNYAFTTCTQCGPRYSIIKQLPYDRENTTMGIFKMCSKCNEEYNDPSNRRHFSQTNSCPDCAIEMRLYFSNQKAIEKNLTQFNSAKDESKNDIPEKEQFSEETISQATAGFLRRSKEAGGMAEEKQFTKEIITTICELWNAGKIVAIKGIGGYLLTCDTTNTTVIKELRLRKHRPTKPFASMFPDIKLLENEVHINEQERKELQSTAAPIVILRLKESTQSRLALNEIAPHLSKIGVMLPYAPLYELLLQEFKKPIIATSGNVSNAPIVFEDETALNELNLIADYILVHNREIIAPQDDSVVQYSRYFQHRIMLRRARGFAPFYLNRKLSVPEKTILATGSLMKSSFTLLHKQDIHVSQYLGDTDNYDTQKNYEKSLHHFLRLFQAQPEVILTDKHPSFFTSQLGNQLAQKWNSKLMTVQHHEAHFASVLGEHNLLDEQEPILGVIWDGTGLGDDNQIWGGEFFVYHQHRFSRVAHFDYFHHFLGDKMATEPRLSAFSLCHEIEDAGPFLQPKLSSAEWANYKHLIKKNNLKTSSVGRIFDAVASLLGLVDKASYEGEAAMLLEEKAHTYFKSGLTIPNEWLEEGLWKSGLSTQSFLKEIVRMINEGNDTSKIAAWFHVQLVLAVKKVASQNLTSIQNLTGFEDLAGLPFQKICFSGGVFQNGLLVDLVLQILGDKCEVHFNKDLSPNDENVSFGQLMIYNNEAGLFNKIV